MDRLLRNIVLLTLLYIYSYGVMIALSPIKLEEKSESIKVIETKEVIRTIKIPNISRGSDRDNTKSLTVKAINKFLKNKLYNKGDVIYDACKIQNPQVCAKLMASIILVEVGGDCDSKVLNEAENVGGLNWFEDCGYPKYNKWYMDFSKHGGIDRSIQVKAEILSKYYIAEGRKDIVSIGLKYAPPNDKRNGIGDMNNNLWVSNVQYWYEKISE